MLLGSLSLVSKELGGNLFYANDLSGLLLLLLRSQLLPSINMQFVWEDELLIRSEAPKIIIHQLVVIGLPPCQERLNFLWDQGGRLAISLSLALLACQLPGVALSVGVVLTRAISYHLVPAFVEKLLLDGV